ncbi:MAG: hypothetical protein U0176_21030 [Bacteroidia bacterium]
MIRRHRCQNWETGAVAVAQRTAPHALAATRPDHRPQTQRLLQLQARADMATSRSPVAQLQQRIHATTAHAQPIVQRGRLLKNGKRKIEVKDMTIPMKRRISRDLKFERSRQYAINVVKKSKSSTPFTGRNNFMVTLNANDLNVTFHLTSAGLGGKHPRFEDRSCAHTEQQWRAFYRSQKEAIRSIFNSKLEKHQKRELDEDQVPQVVMVYSYNEVCNSNPSDKRHGCGGIKCRHMGIDKQTPAYYSRDYETGGTKSGPTKTQLEKQVNQSLKYNLDPDSSDVEIDSDMLRGKHIEDLDDNEIDRIFK